MRLVERGYGHGPIAAHEALVWSCNYYFASVGSMLTAPVMEYWFDLFGVGAAHDSSLLGLTVRAKADLAILRPRHRPQLDRRRRASAARFLAIDK